VLTRKPSHQQRFVVYPAIDVLGGRVVRLSKGRRERVTVDGGDPVAAAEQFAAEGASWLHLVDLDGAFDGTPDLGLLERVAGAGVPVQVGGGYRSLDLVEAALAAGAARVLLGTAALDATFLEAALSRFGREALVVAVDARDGLVTVKGWTEGTAIAAGDLAGRCAAAGVERLLVTSTSRDGTLTGPDLDLLEDVLAAGVPVIAAGGIAALDDLRAVRKLGCEGAVTGSALWRGRFSAAAAFALQA
jgi:phosphoribosylformimino-5-aminoimidazole carboxamide ribotide isomerase